MKPLNLENETVAITLPLVQSFYKPRKPDSHKGDYGHALIIAGSHGKTGAAVLAAKACLRAGVGLLTCYLPKCGYDIMQISVPEAMALTDDGIEYITHIPFDLDPYQSIGFGPGLSTHHLVLETVEPLLRQVSAPLIIDADGLNALSMQKGLLPLLPANTILTPHPKEFDRLFGESKSVAERIVKARQQAIKLKVIVVLKGHRSFIATPSGKGYVNTTGNAGMATGGSGDVLTGIITGLLAQQYTLEEAAVLGVYLHGLAGDMARYNQTEETMIASDIIGGLKEAWRVLRPDSDPETA